MRVKFSNLSMSYTDCPWAHNTAGSSRDTHHLMNEKKHSKILHNEQELCEAREVKGVEFLRAGNRVAARMLSAVVFRLNESQMLIVTAYCERYVTELNVWVVHETCDCKVTSVPVTESLGHECTKPFFICVVYHLLYFSCNIRRSENLARSAKKHGCHQTRTFSMAGRSRNNQ